jgi:hypothetical protein
MLMPIMKFARLNKINILGYVPVSFIAMQSHLIRGKSETGPLVQQTINHLTTLRYTPKCNRNAVDHFGNEILRALFNYTCIYTPFL